jgi:thiamine biosynthesis protein ThiS
MNITLNGQDKKIPAPATLQALIESVCPGGRHVIAEHNDQIVRPDQWPHTTVAEGDRIELVRFVGGG